MRSAISLSLLEQTRTTPCERLLKHFEHRLERLHPNRATADRTEMLFAMDASAAAAGERDVDEALLVAGARGTRQSR